MEVDHSLSIHYGMEPICKRVTTDVPYPIKLTLKKDEVDCKFCIHEMQLREMIEKPERKKSTRESRKRERKFRSQKE